MDFCLVCQTCLAHILLVQNRFVRGGIFWTVPVCKGLSASASYGCDVCAIQIRTESSQGATVFVLLAWTPAFIRKERGVLMDNIRGRSRPLAYLPIPHDATVVAWQFVLIFWFLSVVTIIILRLCNTTYNNGEYTTHLTNPNWCTEFVKTVQTTGPNLHICLQLFEYMPRTSLHLQRCCWYMYKTGECTEHFLVEPEAYTKVRKVRIVRISRRYGW